MSANFITAPVNQKLMRLPKVKDRVALGRSTIYLLVSRGEFPKPVSIGARSVAWIESEVDAWVQAKIGAARGESEAT